MHVRWIAPGERTFKSYTCSPAFWRLPGTNHSVHCCILSVTVMRAGPFFFSSFFFFPFALCSSCLNVSISQFLFVFSFTHETGTTTDSFSLIQLEYRMLSYHNMISAGIFDSHCVSVFFPAALEWRFWHASGLFFCFVLFFSNLSWMGTVNRKVFADRMLLVTNITSNCFVYNCLKESWHQRP